MPELEHVPTVPELYAKGLAVVMVWTDGKDKKPTHYRLKPEGQQMIYDTMRRNAERLKHGI